uniref:Uncharacterized protein n=1 Tax=Echeneis naucrates TaxID=173247 RepID=A0A665TWZ7_ECHNA
VDQCGRSSWWTGTLKDTPIPGHYHIRDFVEEAELNPVRKTYGFKGAGRKAQILGSRNGDLLLPGAYDYTDSIQEVLKQRASYSFKNCPRPHVATLGLRDKVRLRHTTSQSLVSLALRAFAEGGSYLLSKVKQLHKSPCEVLRKGRSFGQLPCQSWTDISGSERRQLNGFSPRAPRPSRRL